MLDSEMLTIILRLILAGVLSGLVGLEREVNKHPAGFRTHLLVGLGSCLIMVLSIYGFGDLLNSNPNPNIRFDPSRLPASVVSGIGFLGAGTILVQGATVRGLTTAASIWVVSAIGLVTGAGMYFISIFATIVVILSLFFLNKWEQLFIRITKIQDIHMIVKYKELPLSSVLDRLKHKGFTIKKVDVERVDETEDDLLKFILNVAFSNEKKFADVFDSFAEMEAVKEITVSEKV